MHSELDFARMRLALDLAGQALFHSSPNPRVGCVIARDENILGQGYTQAPGGHHAEIMALNDCKARGYDPVGATVYVTLEPCSHFGRTPPCVNALIQAKVARVIAAVEDPNPLVAGGGLEVLRSAGIDVRCGLLEQEAREINIGFFSRMIRSRPWVRLKGAMSLDGLTALPDGQSQWITSPAARDDGHRWRARACAVLTGIGTVKSDNPQMNVRAVSTTRQPTRVLVDSRLEVDPSANFVKEGALIYCALPADKLLPEKVELLKAHGCEIVQMNNGQGKVDLAVMIRDLGQRQINELHVEAGAKLNGSLLRAGCIDELLIYQAPLLMFSGAPLFEHPPLTGLHEAEPWELLEQQSIGNDLRLRFRRPRARVERLMSAVQ